MRPVILHSGPLGTSRRLERVFSVLLMFGVCRRERASNDRKSPPIVEREYSGSQHKGFCRFALWVTTLLAGDRDCCRDYLASSVLYTVNYFFSREYHHTPQSTHPTSTIHRNPHIHHPLYTSTVMYTPPIPDIHPHCTNNAATYQTKPQSRTANLRASKMRVDESTANLFGEGSSSVVAAILGEEVFGLHRRRGVRLPGGRHEVDAFEEERPDALCLRCGEWGHITPHCDEAKRSKCAICAKEHTTKDHLCSVEGCKVGRGHMCSHTTTKCANCGGPRGARADVCGAKRIAQHAARGWRSPPPPRREKRRETPGATAPDVEEGGSGVELVAEVEGEGIEE